MNNLKVIGRCRCGQNLTIDHFKNCPYRKVTFINCQKCNGKMIKRDLDICLSCLIRETFSKLGATTKDAIEAMEQFRNLVNKKRND